MLDESSQQYLELQRVQRALQLLRHADPIWSKNHNIYAYMPNNQRAAWWVRAKKQAQLGAPAMRTLLAKVIELRLKE